MSVILEAKRKLLRALNEIDDIIRAEAIKESVYIANLNREQLLEGKKGDGTPTPEYVEGSKQPSAPGNMTFFDSGDFHEGIQPLFTNEGIDMVGIDEKTSILIGKYGKLLDLSQESQAKLRERLKPGIIEKLKKL